MIPVPKITFLPSGVTIEVHEGVTVFNAAARAEVAIPSQCGGRCACALCRIELVEGSKLISPMGWEEEGHLGNSFHLTGERLSCQTRVFGDVVVRVSEVPVKEKARGRFVPRALMKKREEMERSEEMHRVRSGGPASGADSRPARKPRAQSDGKSAGPGKRRGSHRKRGRSRNPGAPRSGDSRPPPGASSDKKGD